MTTSIHEIGQRIKAIRQERGLSQMVLAQKAGVNRRTLWRIEKGDGSCRLSTLAQVLWALGYSVKIEIKGSED